MSQVAITTRLGFIAASEPRTMPAIIVGDAKSPIPMAPVTIATSAITMPGRQTGARRGDNADVRSVTDADTHARNPSAETADATVRDFTNAKKSVPQRTDAVEKAAIGALRRAGCESQRTW